MTVTASAKYLKRLLMIKDLFLSVIFPTTYGNPPLKIKNLKVEFLLKSLGTRFLHKLSTHHVGDKVK